jgi:D-inositol-3-phosphate glycosyltransferase
MKILFVLEYYYPHVGGVETLFKELCEGIHKQGHEVTVVTSRIPATKKFEVLNGINIIRLGVPNEGSRYWFTFFSIPKVFNLASKADIIHTTTYNAAFPAWFASRLRGKPVIITVHEIFGPKWREFGRMNAISAKFHQVFEHMIVKLPFDFLIPVSKYTAECLALHGVKQEKIQVVYNGIDYSLFDPSKFDAKSERKKLGLHDEFIYMYFGRPGISKGLEYLIEAVPLISNRIPNSKLLLVLAKDPLDRYEYILDTIKKLHIESNVIVLGTVPRDALPGLISTSDCVVVPSLSEGFGFSAAEACAMEKPVVASNVASLPEVVSGRNLLVPPKDFEAIAGAVESVYNKKTDFGEKRIFSWEMCVDGYLEIFSKFSRGGRP